MSEILGNPFLLFFGKNFASFFCWNCFKSWFITWNEWKTCRGISVHHKTFKLDTPVSLDEMSCFDLLVIKYRRTRIMKISSGAYEIKFYVQHRLYKPWFCSYTFVYINLRWVWKCLPAIPRNASFGVLLLQLSAVDDHQLHVSCVCSVFVFVGHQKYLWMLTLECVTPGLYLESGKPSRHFDWFPAFLPGIQHFDWYPAFWLASSKFRPNLHKFTCIRNSEFVG